MKICTLFFDSADNPVQPGDIVERHTGERFLVTNLWSYQEDYKHVRARRRVGNNWGDYVTIDLDECRLVPPITPPDPAPAPEPARQPTWRDLPPQL